VTASLVVESERLMVALRNEGAEPVRISHALLAPSLALEVRGEDGSPVALGPPPVPPADPEAEATTLDPGESLELDYATSELFAGEPARGRYRVRFAVDASAPDATRIESSWVELVD
jgi:hypothetical protein